MAQARVPRVRWAPLGLGALLGGAAAAPSQRMLRGWSRDPGGGAPQEYPRWRSPARQTFCLLMRTFPRWALAGWAAARAMAAVAPQMPSPIPARGSPPAMRRAPGWRRSPYRATAGRSAAARATRRRAGARDPARGRVPGRVRSQLQRGICQVAPPQARSLRAGREGRGRSGGAPRGTPCQPRRRQRRWGACRPCTRRPHSRRRRGAPLPRLRQVAGAVASRLQRQQLRRRQLAPRGLRNGHGARPPGLPHPHGVAVAEQAAWWLPRRGRSRDLPQRRALRGGGPGEGGEARAGVAREA